MSLPCLSRNEFGESKCAADAARERIAKGGDMTDVQRGDLDLAAKGCSGPQPDPFDKSLTWNGCPAKAVAQRPDIDGAVTLRALASMAPLRDFPDGYNARVVDTWSAIESERAKLVAT